MVITRPRSVPCCRVPSRCGERGQVVPFMAAVLVLGGLLAVAVVRLGGLAIDRARAQTAADAAALAAVRGGAGRAAALASANGGRLESLRAAGAGDDAAVVVALGGARAAAQAALVVIAPPAPAPAAGGCPALRGTPPVHCGSCAPSDPTIRRATDRSRSPAATGSGACPASGAAIAALTTSPWRLVVPPATDELVPTS